jgi:two-component system, OmpR family, sensor histidine kinase ChvG
MDLYWGGPERRISRMTVRIIGINVAALIMLLIGVIYLGQYQNTLIEGSLRTFKSEIELVSASLSEVLGSPEIAGPPHLETAKRMVWRFSRTMDQRVYLFDQNGALIADSENLEGYEDFHRFEDDRSDTLYAIEVLKKMAKFVLKLLPVRQTLPTYPEHQATTASDYEGSSVALSEGAVSISAWQKNDEIILMAGAPLLKKGRIIGAVMLTRKASDITRDISEVWLNILFAFIITLIITTLLSIYISNIIANPLRKLADAAEAVRRGKSKDTEIPDFSNRKDEIGELSIVMREMTQALWDRMDSIERFAADVAHELKNPLTSLRSAVETVSVVKKDDDRKKLLEIIQHDVERMDRLISDISSASRLDSELSREALEPIDLKETLHALLETYKNPIARSNKMPDHNKIILDCPSDKDIFVWGLKGRLYQVFDNLVANALSFSPSEDKVMIHVRQSRKTVTITIEDPGPGIPENKLETIFERFYTERPEHEAYGKHSGLGLSICKQIVTALSGKIFAENVRDQDGNIRGARFTVILNSV